MCVVTASTRVSRAALEILLVWVFGKEEKFVSCVFLSSVFVFPPIPSACSSSVVLSSLISTYPCVLPCIGYL